MTEELKRAPYRDAGLPLHERLRDLLGRMTREEKIAQLCSVWLTLDPESGEFAPAQSAMTAQRDPGEALRHGIGQITRPFGSRPVAPRDGVRALNAFQRRLLEGTRLGIPAIAHDESLTGFMAQGATQFPSPLNYGATWDPELIERVGAVIRRQMRRVGVHQALAPVADVVRDPRWGRTEECVAEDPLLVGALVSAYVKGLQGEDLSDGVVATLKHFCGYSGSEGGRNFAPTHAGPREMADVFLVPFEMAVKTAGALSVMNAYQDVDGVPCAASRELLTETLRERWGFDGIVVADYFAVKMLYTLHRVATGPRDAAAAALRAGLDVELPSGEVFPEGLAEALEAGDLGEEVLNAAVERVLRLKLRLGIFERPYADDSAFELEQREDRELAREVAERSLVLLANDGTLPLAPDLARVAVVGPNADDALALFGNYSFQNHVASHFPERAVAETAPTVLAALRQRLGEERVGYARGCRILRPAGDGPDDVARPRPDLDDDVSGIAEAVELARGADVAVLVLGDRAGHFRSGTVGEGSDTDDLSLPGVQGRLLDAVLDSGTPTVVVLVNGRPLALGEAAGRSCAVLEAWFPGQDGGAAIADVLCGVVEPGGRTSVTFPSSAGVQPLVYNRKPLSEGVPKLPTLEPVYPFGHGLGYTRFEYTELVLDGERLPTDGILGAGFQLRNTGERRGCEVVQLYLRDAVASVTRPLHELRGFRRIELDPGQAVRVTFRIPAELFGFTGPALRRIVEPGAVEIQIGASSTDIRLRADLELVGDVREVGEQRVFSAEVEVEPV